MYFNTVPFSDNAFGIKTASNIYFGKPVDSLNVQEAAMLVGMLKAPSEVEPTYNGRKPPCKGAMWCLIKCIITILSAKCNAILY